jgi:hypothetical protein
MKTIGRPRTTNHELIRQEIEQNHPAMEISTKYEISTALVYKIAKENNLKISHPQPRERKYDYKLILDTYFELNQNGYKTDEKLNLPYSTTSKVLKVLSVSHLVQSGRKKENLTPEILLSKHPLYKKILDLHNLGNRPVEIDRILGFRGYGVSARILTRLNVHHIGQGSHLKIVDIPKEDVMKMYSDGNGTAKIGKKYKVCGKVIARILEENNIERRIGGASGSQNSQWKDGRSKEDTMHYFRRQSYEVVAICLGKPLQQGYIVHHLDENHKNNHPDNLIIFPSLKAHSSFHQKVLRLQHEVKKEEAIRLAIESGASLLPKPPNPIEF